MSLIIERIDFDEVFDDIPDISYLEQYDENSKDVEERKYSQQDKERLEAYYNDEWHFIGIRAKAEIRINGISQEIISSGLYGIESDSSVEYFNEVFEEQKEELHELLLEIGFNEKDFEDLEK